MINVHYLDSTFQLWFISAGNNNIILNFVGGVNWIPNQIKFKKNITPIGTENAIGGWCKQKHKILLNCCSSVFLVWAVFLLTFPSVKQKLQVSIAFLISTPRQMRVNLKKHDKNIKSV
jgi:hypothetical protein